ncbi:MAG TPA: sulfite exporter TauE/SafE family protein [Propionibacteriaceae bacterium]
MSWGELLLIALAGGAAGLINTVVGTGTLITFPTLLALGVPPLLANVSNSIGLAPGSISGALASRQELVGQRKRILRYGVASLIGAIGGALLLLRLPSEAFDAIVPVLIGLGCLLVIIGPWLSRRVAARRERLGTGAGPVDGPLWLFPVIVLTGAYGGYFGAAQGVLVIAVMGVALSAESLPRINGLKNVLTGIANAVAGVVFIVISHVSWPIVAALAVGSVIGAQVGARVGRKIPPTVYRVVIVGVGLAAIINLLR